MRISDWSSDVCSSDLDALATQLAQIEHAIRPVATRIEELAGDADNAQRVASLRETIRQQLIPLNLDAAIAADMRSEEHTSELQSLMRISYAVFCLKKKKQQPYHILIVSQIQTTQQKHI